MQKAKKYQVPDIHVRDKLVNDCVKLQGTLTIRKETL